MTSVSKICDFCQKYALIEIQENSPLYCPHCQKPWPAVKVKTIFENCPFCQCRQFYIQKDFNQALGCLVMLIGIFLVPLTYGLSLPVFAFFDWLLFQRTQTMAICYRCGVEFRGFAIPDHFKSFMHHIGEKYEQEKGQEKP